LGVRRSRSHEAQDRFGGLVEASFLTPLGRVAFLVCCYAALLCSRRSKLPAESQQLMSNLLMSLLTHEPVLRSEFKVTRLRAALTRNLP